MAQVPCTTVVLPVQVKVSNCSCGSSDTTYVGGWRGTDTYSCNKCDDEWDEQEKTDDFWDCMNEDDDE